jgi:hypothetical protein
MARAQIKVRHVAAQGERPRHFGHVDLAAHGKADLAVGGVEHRKIVARRVLEFPILAAGIDPRPVRMGAAVARRRAAVGIGHDDEIVGGRGLAIDRLDGAEHHVHAVGRGGLRHGRGRVERRRHAPRPGIGLGEADEVGALVGGVLDGAHGVGDVVLVFAGRV